MSNKKKWIISLIIAVSITILAYVLSLILVLNPSLSNAFDNFFGGVFAFKDDLQEMSISALWKSIIVIPIATLIFRLIFELEGGLD